MDDMFKNYMEMCNKMLENVTTYYKFSTQVMEKFMDVHNQQPGGDKFPLANGHEIYNYIARYGVSNLQIQAIMKLDGRLDFDKLNQAVRLSVEAEPILKFRFVEEKPPHWEPLKNLGFVNFCSLQEVNDIDAAVRDFIVSPVNLDIDPMLHVRLLRSEQCDVLALRVNHTFCDAAGVKEYIQLLTDIYTTIDKEDGQYIPVPRIGGRKDQDRLFEELGIINIDSIFKPGADLFQPMWSFPWEPCGSNIPCMSVCQFPDGILDGMIEYAKIRGATVNDLILTACYRAMIEMKEPVYGIPMEFPITIDLRRYLSDHKTSAIRNFSGAVNTKLDMILNEPFNETVQRVSNMTKGIKQTFPGLQSAIGLERIERMNFQEVLSYYHAVVETKKTQSFCPLYSGDRCLPTLSNVGYVSNSLIKFADSSVIDAYILPPVVRAPGLLLMASSYNSVLTLAAGYYKSTINGEYIDELLRKIKDELISGCGG